MRECITSFHSIIIVLYTENCVVELLERIIPSVYKYYYTHFDQYKSYGFHIVKVNSIAPLIGIAGNISSVKHLISFWISLNHVNSNLMSCVKRSSRIQCVSGTMSECREVTTHPILLLIKLKWQWALKARRHVSNRMIHFTVSCSTSMNAFW